MSSLTFRKAQPGDETQISDLVNTAYRGERAKKGWTTEAYILDGGRTDPENILRLIEDPEHYFLMVTRENQLVGCADFHVTPTGLYLGMVTVDPEIQNLGIGRKILEEAEVQARNFEITRLYMTVIDERTELIDWYLRRGYQKTDTVLPFPHNSARFGIPNRPLQFIVLEKHLPS